MQRVGPAESRLQSVSGLRGTQKRTGDKRLPFEQVEVAGNSREQNEQIRMISLICNVAAWCDLKPYIQKL